MNSDESTSEDFIDFVKETLPSDISPMIIDTYSKTNNGNLESKSIAGIQKKTREILSKSSIIKQWADRNYEESKIEAEA